MFFLIQLLISIDIALLYRVFTPLAHVVERRTGFTNLYLAWWALSILPLSWVLLVASVLRMPDGIIPALAMSAAFLFSFLSIRPLFALLAREVNKQMKNRARRLPFNFPMGTLRSRITALFSTLFFFGLYTLIFSFIAAVTGLYILTPGILCLTGMLGSLAAEYLASVEPPPPQDEKEEAPTGGKLVEV